MEIEISALERRRGRMDEDKKQAAVEAFGQDGFVVLLDAVEAAHLEKICHKMLGDVDYILQQEPPPYQFVQGHIQHDPPLTSPYLFADIYYNEMVIAVAKEILGDGMKTVGITGNTNVPGSLQQPVHVDNGQLWPGLNAAHPTCELVVNIAPLDVGPANGATQLWPGSHLDTTVSRRDPSIEVPAAVVEERRKVVAPVQATIPLGGVLLRDMRLWHRGMPNEASTPRPMLALIMACAWMGSGSIGVPPAAAAFFSHPVLNIPVTPLIEPVDYLHRHKPYDYTP